ncbi:hypothetical protein SNEBB_003479 [Seison nebaliae]|nr:hypothetical protein SNEBB_003479 [Seison nebaliae]
MKGKPCNAPTVLFDCESLYIGSCYLPDNIDWNGTNCNDVIQSPLHEIVNDDLAINGHSCRLAVYADGMVADISISQPNNLAEEESVKKRFCAVEKLLYCGALKLIPKSIREDHAFEELSNEIMSHELVRGNPPLFVVIYHNDEDGEDEENDNKDMMHVFAVRFDQEAKNLVQAMVSSHKYSKEILKLSTEDIEVSQSEHEMSEKASTVDDYIFDQSSNDEGLKTPSNGYSTDTEINRLKKYLDRKHIESSSTPTSSSRCSSSQFNLDPNPKVIVKKTDGKPVKYDQDVFVRWLKPTTPPPAAPVYVRVRQETPKPEPPPIIIKQREKAPPTPPPLIVRERPPKLPLSYDKPFIIERKVPAPPPGPRKVIIERIPAPPPKPRPIIYEKWLPQQTQKRPVIIQHQKLIPRPPIRRVVKQFRQQPEPQQQQQQQCLMPCLPICNNNAATYMNQTQNNAQAMPQIIQGHLNPQQLMGEYPNQCYMVQQ